MTEQVMNREENQADLLVTGKYLYLQDKEKTFIRDGGVAMRGDTIVETGSSADLAAKNTPVPNFLPRNAASSCPA